MKAAPHSVGPKATCLVGLFRPVTSHLAESVWSPHPAGEGRDVCSGPSGWQMPGRGRLPLLQCRRALGAPVAGICAPGSHASVRLRGAGQHIHTPGAGGAFLSCQREGQSTPLWLAARLCWQGPCEARALQSVHPTRALPCPQAASRACVVHWAKKAGSAGRVQVSPTGPCRARLCSVPVTTRSLPPGLQPSHRRALSIVLSLLPALLASLRQPLLWLHC